MNIKINEQGLLFIQRGKIYKEQFCPFSSRYQKPVYCSDLCPLFYTHIQGIEGQKYVDVQLCKTKYRVHINDFKDERN